MPGRGDGRRYSYRGSDRFHPTARFCNGLDHAGTAAGALAGLTGLAMLELHCQNLKAIHVIVWHVAVVVTSGALGWAIGRIVDASRTSRIALTVRDRAD